MNFEELKNLDKNLAEEEDKILAQLRDFAKENPIIKDDFDVVVLDLGASLEDAAQEATELDRDQMALKYLVKRLKEIKKTREKIKTGDYGRCETCLQDINQDRLKVMPIASLCMVCASKNKTF